MARVAVKDGSDAVFRLGFLYDEGTAVGRDKIEAHMRYDLVAASGAASAAEKRDALVGVWARRRRGRGPMRLKNYKWRDADGA